MSPEPYWRRVGSQLVPEPIARTPWAENMLHGRLLTALAARAVEREHGDSDFHCVRLTVDLFRAATMDPVEVVTEPVRTGGRVRAVDVEITSNGKAIVRASALLLRHGAQLPSQPWLAPEWAAPHPDELPTVETPETRFLLIEAREVTPGGFRAAGRKQLWLRELCSLVAGEEWTPFTRVAALADLANAVANCGEEPNTFINADVTLYLGRLSASEWIGMEATGHVSDAGVAIGSCDLYDTRGRFGACTVGAVASPVPLALPEPAAHGAA